MDKYYKIQGRKYLMRVDIINALRIYLLVHKGLYLGFIDLLFHIKCPSSCRDVFEYLFYQYFILTIHWSTIFNTLWQ